MIGQRAPGLTTGGIVHMGRHWTNGLLWSDISPAGTCQSGSQRPAGKVEHDLNDYPDILAELAHVPPSIAATGSSLSPRQPPSHGGVKPSAWLGAASSPLPVSPADIRNGNSGAGCISEAYEAGAETSDVMKHSGHKTAKISARYNRGVLIQSKRVARLRVSKRSGNDGNRNV